MAASATALPPVTLEVDRPGMEDVEASDRLASRALSGALSAAANARAHLSERPPPDLRRNRTGGYSYAHHVFDATIAPDGTVSFRDHPPVSMNTPDLSPGGLIPGGSFDLTDATMADPYRYEKEWFLHATEELRDRMADRYERRLATRGLRRLRQRLERLWGRRSRTAERRAAIFALWDECMDGAGGRPARAVVEEFVRRRLPMGSAGAFGAAELGALNRHRHSRERFEPYSSGPPTRVE